MIADSRARVSSDDLPAIYLGAPVVGSVWVNAIGDRMTVTGCVASSIDELGAVVTFRDAKLNARWLPLDLWQAWMQPASAADLRPTHLQASEL